VDLGPTANSRAARRIDKVEGATDIAGRKPWWVRKLRFLRRGGSMMTSNSLVATTGLLLIGWLAGCATVTTGAGGSDGYIGDEKARYVVRRENPTNAVIFVHGVLGNAASTWRNDATGAFWPTLVANDPAFARSSVYLYQYPTNALGANLSVNELAEDMRRTLDADGVTSHPELIFVSHSMGGLVTRSFLLKYRQHAAKVKMLYFFATPTEGSPMAVLAGLVRTNPQLRMMYPMKSDSALADLQRDWLAAQLGVRSFCAYEGKPTFGVLIVDQRSATNLCTEPLDPILEDHIDIVKPASREDASYVAFRNAFIKSARDGGVVPRMDRAKIDHPLIDPAVPLSSQVQLFPEDKVRVYMEETVRTRVDFGGGWQPLNANRTYVVIGVPGTPVVPKFDPLPVSPFKIEVEYIKYGDLPRDLKSGPSHERGPVPKR
jgi:pimeloyl-ACP methyl ester carboxylesterase